MSNLLMVCHVAPPFGQEVCFILTQTDRLNHTMRNQKMSTLTCGRCQVKFERLTKHVNYEIRKHGKNKFNCSKCRSRNGSLHKCATCSVDVYICKSTAARSKTGNHFCSRSCAVSLRNRSRLGELHPNWNGGTNTYRSHMGAICEECGELRSFLLIVHHKDGKRSNNERSNHETLCLNCHGTRHVKIINGEPRLHFKSLTDPAIRQFLKSGSGSEIRTQDLILPRDAGTAILP